MKYWRNYFSTVEGEIWQKVSSYISLDVIFSFAVFPLHPTRGLIIIFVLCRQRPPPRYFVSSFPVLLQSFFTDFSSIFLCTEQRRTCTFTNIISNSAGNLQLLFKLFFAVIRRGPSLN